jgi:alpha-tubulin suppressor-like RCC1 family protein
MGMAGGNVVQPTRLPSSLQFASVSAGDLHTCAVAPLSTPVTAAGRAWCWGSNEWGQLGAETETGEEG